MHACCSVTVSFPPTWVTQLPPYVAVVTAIVADVPLLLLAGCTFILFTVMNDEQSNTNVWPSASAAN